MMMVKFLRFGRRQLHTIISQETIKPSFATPSYLQTYNLSLLDQLVTKTYIPLLLFYPNNGNRVLSSHDKAQKLKKSLSQSLTQYYPFAGRLRTPTTPYVDCNDDGVVFIEAKIDCKLKTVREDENLEQLIPDSLLNGNIVGVQVNHFACGGMGVAVSMLHTIGDGCTLGSFVNYWASVARYGLVDNEEVLPLNPRFISFPSTNSIQPEAPVFIQGHANSVTRKFVFPNTKLSELKNKVIDLASTGSTPPIKSPTRVEVLTSLLYQTAMRATTTKSNCFQPSNLLMGVNIRNMFVEKLPQTTVGNLASVIMVPTMDTTETSLDVLVAEIKKAKLQFEVVQSVQHAAEIFKSVQLKLGKQYLEDVATTSYVCSSICGFPFNKVDFGWGKPIGSTLAFKSTDKNCIVLKDTPDGDGIEALACLEKEDMEIFQDDKEMLSFCEVSRFEL